MALIVRLGAGPLIDQPKFRLQSLSLFFVQFLFFAMNMGAHHPGIFRIAVVMMFMVVIVMFVVMIMGMGHAFMAVGMALEKLKLFVLAGVFSA